MNSVSNTEILALAAAALEKIRQLEDKGIKAHRGDPGRPGNPGPPGPRGQSVKGDTGRPGRGIADVRVEGRDLIVQFDDGSSRTLERALPQPAKAAGIANIRIDQRRLIVELTDGRRLDAGKLPTAGGEGPSREAIATVVAEEAPVQFQEIEIEGQKVVRLVAKC